MDEIDDDGEEFIYESLEELERRFREMAMKHNFLMALCTALYDVAVDKAKLVSPQQFNAILNHWKQKFYEQYDPDGDGFKDNFRNN